MIKILHPDGDTVTLDHVIAEYRRCAEITRRLGYTKGPNLIDQICDAVAKAAADYLEWIPEDQAALQSGRTIEWLRARFAGWESRGHARQVARSREYRAIVIPQRDRLKGAASEGRPAARRVRVA